MEVKIILVAAKPECSIAELREVKIKRRRFIAILTVTHYELHFNVTLFDIILERSQN